MKLNCLRSPLIGAQEVLEIADVTPVRIKELSFSFTILSRDFLWQQSLLMKQDFAFLRPIFGFHGTPKTFHHPKFQSHRDWLGAQQVYQEAAETQRNQQQRARRFHLQGSG